LEVISTDSRHLLVEGYRFISFDEKDY
jgi:hypothetical protein